MYSMLSLKGICSILTIQKGQTVSKQNKVFSLLNLNTYKSLTTLNRIRWILPAWLFELTSYEVYKAQQIKFKNAASKGVKFKICLPYITSWSFSFLIAKLLFYRFFHWFTLAHVQTGSVFEIILLRDAKNYNSPCDLTNFLGSFLKNSNMAAAFVLL